MKISDLIGFWLPTKKTTPQYRYDSLSQRDVRKLKIIRRKANKISMMNQYETGRLIALMKMKEKGGFKMPQLLKLQVVESVTKLNIGKAEHLQLAVEDFARVAIFRDQRPYVIPSPPTRRTFKELTGSELYELTRFRSVRDLEKLAEHLRLPISFRARHGHVFHIEEVVIVSLARFSTGNTMPNLVKGFFGGDVNKWYSAFRAFVDHVFLTFYHRICGRSLDFIKPQVQSFINVIATLMAKQPTKEETAGDEDLFNSHKDFYKHINPRLWRIWGFVDATNQKTCRPGSGPIRATKARRAYCQFIQQCFYSGYLRAHGLKALTVTLVNGLFGAVYVAPMAHNDIGAWNMSGLEQYLSALLDPIPSCGGQLPALYGDKIFKKAAGNPEVLVTQTEYQPE